MRARTTHRQLVGLLSIVAVIIWAVLLGPFAAQPALAAKTAVWERYDTTIDVRPDGVLGITEDQVIRFSGGTFSEGYAIIPLSRVESITNIRVFEGDTEYRRGYGDPGTFSASVYSGEVEILWWFEPAENETRQFTIMYDAVGALRVYPDTGREQLWWRAVDEDFAGDVNSATVSVNLPQQVSPEQLTIDQYVRGGEEATHEIVSPTTIQWHIEGLDQGDAFEARVEFPRMTTAQVPAWQAADDKAREEAERLAPYKALANVIMLLIGLLLLVGGPIGVVLFWYTRGRDAPVALPIDLLREPPDDLPAAAVGTLIDETANDHDVIAGLVALGERGVLEIDEREREGPLAGFLSSKREFVFRRVDDQQELAPFEKELMRAVFGNSKKDEVRLSQIRERFAERQKEVKEDLYKEVVARGYFTRSPQSTRTLWYTLGGLTFGGAVALAIFLYSAVASFLPLAIVPIITVGFLGLVILAFAGAMPRKTPAGAEAAARWLAFRRYLAEIERYENVANAREVFNRYLPYAVAFGLEKSWVAKFASVGADPPEWYGPRGWDADWSPQRRRRRGGTVVLPGGMGRSGGRSAAACKG
ncbi:MAG: hypothetical protein DCC58_09070 [Chloroflexi bacterium]|nr:MAG: hypothetical protein DCC58_09070 [Chloroflexota bacterium]